MSDFQSNTYLFGASAGFLEGMYAMYIKSPEAIDQSWREYFKSLGDNPSALEGFLNSIEKSKAVANPLQNEISEAFSDTAQKKPITEKSIGKDTSALQAVDIQQTIEKIANIYRTYGHTAVNLDPLNIAKQSASQEIFAINENSKNADFISKKLRDIYTTRIGYEFMHIESKEVREWFANYLEKEKTLYFSSSQKLKLLQDLFEITALEEYLHVKFPGAKRFSIEGSESVVVAAEYIVSKAAKYGLQEIVLGMAHRGRLNTLTKILKKPYSALFSEFTGNFAFPANHPGDVKYHLGASCDREVEGGKVHLSLLPNPSHLEAVNPVVVGRVRARQDDIADVQRSKVAAIMMHGDAAIVGQGSVAETMVLSGLPSYNIGGVIHIVINNQIGFTTLPSSSRTARYCTDIAKSIGAPILHVNGDDIEAVIFATQLALDYKAKFHKDVFIDIVGYRRYGHNEGDEPFFTQPIMYNAISNHKTPPIIYRDKLISEGVITEERARNIHDNFKLFLDKEYELSKTHKNDKFDWLNGVWNSYVSSADQNASNTPTGVDEGRLREIGVKLTTVPSDFSLNSKIERQLLTKRKSIGIGENIDWGTGEALALASLLDEGICIRMSGQDVERGTFSHRHAVLTDQTNEKKFTPLNNLRDDQVAKIEICNSYLSELGVLGFEYGYSLAAPGKLVIWEAQFGDFANGAQVLIDQFIVSAEAKWLRMSGITLLLPHGYEGQGPEHSSARLERFLQLCANNNIQVANCTTPASLFHILRRQVHRNYRKPLILMTPKSLLRHKLAVSKISDIGKGTQFNPLIPENDQGILPDKNIRKVIICSGKVYFDLYEMRAEKNAMDIVILRLEQIYPMPINELETQLLRYTNAKVIWCQEEHENMGAFRFVKDLITGVLQKINHFDTKLDYIGRPESASTAAGYGKLHSIEHDTMMQEAFS